MVKADQIIDVKGQLCPRPLLITKQRLKTMQSGTVLKEGIAPGAEVAFKIFVEPFSYTDDYNVSIGASCR